MVRDFITKHDLPLFSSGARFTLGAVIYLENKHKIVTTYDLFIRDLPSSRNYLVFAGLEHILSFLLNYKLRPEHLSYFKKYFKFNKKVLNFYKNLRFTGDVYAVPEGSLVFPNEPLIRISAPTVEGMVIEQYLLNTVMLQTMLASKISRLIIVANNKKIGLTFPRTHGTDAALKAVRCGKIVGMQLIGLPLATLKYDNMPGSYSAMTCHYFISFFDSEKQAFQAYIKHFKGGGDILIDTYDNMQGLRNLIEVMKEGKGLVKKVALDSGNLTELSKKVRKILDKNGFNNIGIIAMSNLDEYKVKKMEDAGSKADIYGAATEVINCPDAPSLETVYKISETRDGKVIKPKMKLSQEKLSLPGRKQVFRIEKNGKYVEDIIGLEKENIKGKKLLVPYIKNGKLVRKLPSIPEINKYYERERKKFKPSLFNINRKINYKVSLSNDLKSLIKETRADIIKKNFSKKK